MSLDKADLISSFFISKVTKIFRISIIYLIIESNFGVCYLLNTKSAKCILSKLITEKYTVFFFLLIIQSYYFERFQTNNATSPPKKNPPKTNIYSKEGEANPLHSRDGSPESE